jgi:hypothetical protein
MKKWNKNVINQFKRMISTVKDRHIQLSANNFAQNWLHCILERKSRAWRQKYWSTVCKMLLVVTCYAPTGSPVLMLSFTISFDALILSWEKNAENNGDKSGSNKKNALVRTREG